MNNTNNLITITRGPRGRRRAPHDNSARARQSAAVILVDLQATVADYLEAMDPLDLEEMAEIEGEIDDALIAALMQQSPEVLRRLPMILDPILSRWTVLSVLGDGDGDAAEQQVGAWLVRRHLPVRALEQLGAEWFHEPSLEERLLVRERAEPRLALLCEDLEEMAEDDDDREWIEDEIDAITKDDHVIGYVGPSSGPALP